MNILNLETVIVNMEEIATVRETGRDDESRSVEICLKNGEKIHAGLLKDKKLSDYRITRVPGS